MRTLHTSYRVSNLAASLDFYTALGYEQVGRVDLGANASLTMLKFPGEEVVTLELVHRPEDGPVDIGTGFSHIPVQVDDLAAALGQLSEARLTDSAGMWPRALVIAVSGLLRPSRPHAKGSRGERHDAALAPAPRRVRVTRGFDEIVLLVSAFSELPTRHLFSDAVRWK